MNRLIDENNIRSANFKNKYAYGFSGLKIQAETHDSVEDARTALQLYKKYKELEANGTLQASLEEMYALGKSLQWKIPGQQSTQ